MTTPGHGLFSYKLETVEDTVYQLSHFWKITHLPLAVCVPSAPQVRPALSAGPQADLDEPLMIWNIASPLPQTTALPQLD